jgi:hypothetical protein
MSQFWGLMWNVKPGTEQTVEELFRNSGRPEHDIRGADGSIRGKLLQTMVFLKGNTIVRIIEFEGCDLPEVAMHMRRQQAIVDLERALDDLVEIPRDMSTPEKAQQFFRESSMRCILHRRHDQ